MSGCGKTDDTYNRVINLRNQIAESDACAFKTQICADYEDVTYTFEMLCRSNSDGGLDFEVTHPDSIAGITGNFGDDYSNIIFDDHVLAFERIADGRITPVSAPWVFIKALRSGYIRGCTETESGVKAIIDDSYEDDAFQLYIWLDSLDRPQSAEIYWNDRRVLSLTVSEFSLM